VPSEWRVEPGAGGGAAWESGGVALTRGGLWTWGAGTVGLGQRWRRGEFRRRHGRGCRFVDRGRHGHADHRRRRRRFDVCVG